MDRQPRVIVYPAILAHLQLVRPDRPADAASRRIRRAWFQSLPYFRHTPQNPQAGVASPGR